MVRLGTSEGEGEGEECRSKAGGGKGCGEDGKVEQVFGLIVRVVVFVFLWWKYEWEFFVVILVVYGEWFDVVMGKHKWHMFVVSVRVRELGWTEVGWNGFISNNRRRRFRYNNNIILSKCNSRTYCRFNGFFR